MDGFYQTVYTFVDIVVRDDCMIEFLVFLGCRTALIILIGLIVWPFYYFSRLIAKHINKDKLK